MWADSSTSAMAATERNGWEPMIELAWAAATHPGNRRARNEDAFLVRPPVFAVADGMGGHAAGDVASALAVAALGRAADEGALTRAGVLAAVRAADASITEQAREPDRAGMGTTLCGLAITGSGSHSPRLVVFNVGDSRAYRLRGSELTQLTHDHSVVQELIDAGSITEDESVTHPDRNVVTRSLGTGDPLEIDWWSLDPASGDRYLLASDGLTKEIDPEAAAAILAGGDEAQATADRLVEAALVAGGRDNITVIVIDVGAMVVTDDPLSELDMLNEDTNPRHGETEPAGHVGLDPVPAADADPGTEATPGQGHARSEEMAT